MSRLKHPVRAIREPFGTAGLIVAMVALVAALGGTALAAKGALTGKQKKEVEKIAMKYAGKPGKNGENGSPGAQGPVGPAGPKGDSGATGSPGGSGAAGATGATGATGTKGSTGPAGATGASGFTETLPSGATETGVWSVEPAEYPEPRYGLDRVPISFNIPLAEPLDGSGCYITEQGGPFIGPCHVHYINAVYTRPIVGHEPEYLGGQEVISNTESFQWEEQPSAECQGTVAEPSAEPGNLCIYTALEEHMFAADSTIFDYTAGGRAPNGEIGAGVAGTTIDFISKNSEENEEELFEGSGTWAVTAP